MYNFSQQRYTLKEQKNYKEIEKKPESVIFGNLTPIKLGDLESEITMNYDYNEEEYHSNCSINDKFNVADMLMKQSQKVSYEDSN